MYRKISAKARRSLCVQSVADTLYLRKSSATSKHPRTIACKFCAVALRLSRTGSLSAVITVTGLFFLRGNVDCISRTKQPEALPQILEQFIIGFSEPARSTLILQA
jgi:hypothetical protein